MSKFFDAVNFHRSVEYKKEYNRLIKENEMEADSVLGRLQLILASIYLIGWLLHTFGLFGESLDISIATFASFMVLTLLGLFMLLKKKTKPMPWLKYVSISMILVTILAINIVTGYKVWLLYALPILLTIRYYNRKFTTIAAALALLITAATPFANAYLSPFTRILDLNLVSYSEPGTLEYWSWLHNAVLDKGFDPELVVANGFRLSVLPNGMIIILLTIAANSVINNAVKNLMRESENHKREIGLIREATTDEMTGLKNRRAYSEDAAEISDKTAGNLVLIMFDVDGLKETNDNIGHSAGDELIIAAATCIKDVFDPYGRVYRWGGDEIVALAYMDDEHLKKIKAGFTEKVSMWSGEQVKRLSISFGSARASEIEPFSMEALEALADQRMYEMKTAHYEMKK